MQNRSNNKNFDKNTRDYTKNTKIKYILMTTNQQF